MIHLVLYNPPCLHHTICIRYHVTPCASVIINTYELHRLQPPAPQGGIRGSVLCFLEMPASSCRFGQNLAGTFRQRVPHASRNTSLAVQQRLASSASGKDRVIFSGIQPTGVPHIGNYLGALQQWMKLQDSSSPGTRLLYSIVDLHAITIPQDPTQLRIWKKESLATLLAVGLDPDRSIIFYQSSVCFTWWAAARSCD
jgi:hypothetical protein